MSRLYANENFPVPVVNALIALGHDVLTTLTAGNAGQSISDAEVLRFAIETDRALITLNRRHFLKLVAGYPNHPGLIVCTVDPDFQRQANAIHSQIASISNLTGQVIRINRPA